MQSGALNGRGLRWAPDGGLGPRRQFILELLAVHPGLNFDEVARALNVRRTAAKHHLHALKRLGYVVQARQGRHLLNFLSGVPPLEMAFFCMFRVPSVRRVAEALFANPIQRRDRLAAELEVSQRTVRRALQQLTRQGLARIEPTPEGLTVHLHPHIRVLLARRPEPQEPAAPSPAEDTS